MCVCVCAYVCACVCYVMHLKQASSHLLQLLHGLLLVLVQRLVLGLFCLKRIAVGNKLGAQSVNLQR